MSPDLPLAITGLGALSALGEGVAAHHEAVQARRIPFQRLEYLLGRKSRHADCPAGWIENRSLLTNRKWSPATMAALHVAREAIAAAAWTSDDCRDAAMVIGTSRGNAAGWLGPWPGRRPFRLMAASNTIHSEPATAISIEFGITGPNHILASGCSAGLDAVGIAMMLVRSGLAPRALVVAVDLPLVEILLDNYAASGMLARNLSMDPYHVSAGGMIPAEGAAAITIEGREGTYPRLLHYNCNSDAADPVGIPKDGGRTPTLIHEAIGRHGIPAALCPHATGTAVQSVAEPAALDRAFPDARPTLHLLKPFVGHTIGASGLLETVLLCRFLHDGKLPPNAKGLSSPPGFSLPDETLDASGPIHKLSHGMGGHNALIVISPT